MSGPTRYETVERGGLYQLTVGDRSRSVRAVVNTVSHTGDGYVVSFDGGSEAFVPEDQDEFGSYTFESGREQRLVRLKQLVPPSQVRYPGVSVGDKVKIGTGGAAYRVDDVADGFVTLEDGRSIPVTKVTAFDEDVTDYDPFNVIPGDIGDLFGGGGQ